MIVIQRMSDAAFFVLPALAVEIVWWDHPDLPIWRPDHQKCGWMLAVHVGWGHWHRVVEMYGRAKGKEGRK
jgi:hypothetical protein